MVWSLNKRGLALTLVLVLLTMNNLYAKDRILEWKTLPNKEFDCSEIRSINLFIDNDNNIFVLTDKFLYINNNWIKVDKYGRLLNGFSKDRQFYMAFEKDGNIDVYNIKKDFGLISRIKIIEGPNILWRSARFQRIFVVPGEDNSYFLQGQCYKLPTNPFQSIFCFTSGGHGITYVKPILAEMRDDKMIRYLKFRYRGKLDESFYIKEASGGENSISFLGFRQLEKPAFGPNTYPPQPIILHYTDYDLKKKKVSKSHTIYENTPGYNKNTDTYSDYGPLSMDNFSDDVFIVFSWRERSQINTKGFDIKNFKSDIYHWEYNNGRFGNTEKIAEGFSPIVKADLLGNVHVLWLNSNGHLFHKVKKNGIWSEKRTILNNVNIKNITFRTCISVEFDKDDNLNVIFPSNGNLVYSKIRPY